MSVTTTDTCSLVREEVVTLAGWPTEVVSIVHDAASTTTTTTTGSCGHADASTPSSPQRNIVVVFVPGNPGCIGWYTSCLQQIVQRVQTSLPTILQQQQQQQSGQELVVTARGVSHAGHSPQGLPPGITTSISWTLQGQIEHKSAFVDWILEDMGLTVTTSTGTVANKNGNTNTSTNTNTNTANHTQWPSFIFVSHSIGSHIVERLLIARPDLLHHTIGVLHLMPFTRMQALPPDQARLDFGAIRPESLIRSSEILLRVLHCLPKFIIHLGMMAMMDHAKHRELAMNLILQRPNTASFPRTFFTLGTEEIRTVPKMPDVPTLQVIASHCLVAMLYADMDRWAPKFHMLDLQHLQQQGIIPSNVSFTFRPDLRHDFVSYQRMVPLVLDWCCDSIHDMLTARASSPPTLRSKL